MQPLSNHSFNNPEISQKNYSSTPDLPAELWTEVIRCLINSIGKRTPDQVGSNYETEKKTIGKALASLKNVMFTRTLFFRIIQGEKARFINSHHLSLKALGFKTAKEAAAFAIENQLTSVNLVGYENEIDDSLIHNLEERLPKLRHLFIPYASITDIGLGHLSTLQNLASLNLHWCDKITNTGLGHLSKLRNLASLNLSGCDKITDTGLGHLSTLQNLASLNLHWCDKITDIGLGHLSKLRNLASLNLHWCDKITDIGLGHLSKLRNLASLNLRECDKITDTGLGHLSTLQNLASLNLRECYKITKEGIAQLKKHFPGLQIQIPGLQIQRIRDNFSG